MKVIVKYPHSVDFEGKLYVPGESLPEDMPKKEAERLLKKGRVQIPGPAENSNSGAETKKEADAEVITEMKAMISELEDRLQVAVTERGNAVDEKAELLAKLQVETEELKKTKADLKKAEADLKKANEQLKAKGKGKK